MTVSAISHFLSTPLIFLILLFRRSHGRFDGTVRNVYRLFSNLQLGLINSSFPNVVYLLGWIVLGILVKSSISLDRKQNSKHLIPLDMS